MDPNLSLPSQAELVRRIVTASGSLEFHSFVLGFWRPGKFVRLEHESRFRALKIAVGDALVSLWPGREVDFDRPEVRFDIRADLEIDIQLSPLFLAGRYRKFSREIPSTRWIHHRCRGRGCPVCNYSGNLCGPSVQELVEGPALAASGGTGSLFHGLGREDTDVRMLGRGRPFVLEITRPHRRSLDLAALHSEIARGTDGLAEISPLTPVNRDTARELKAVPAEKTYRAVVEICLTPPPDAPRRAEALSGKTVQQQTPLRLGSRRGAKTVRSKRVVESTWLGAFEEGYLWEVRAESGTYIKELVSGDGGRTVPSLSDLLGTPCRAVTLDVLEVHWDPPWET